MIPITEANEILEICKDQDKQIESLLKMYDKQLTELINIMKDPANTEELIAEFESLKLSVDNLD